MDEVRVVCRGASAGCDCSDCAAMREAAAVGARPPGVPLRVYGGYLEARSALRSGAPTLANETLAWLLGHLAEERGAAREASLSAKLETLRARGAIGPSLRRSLLERATAVEGDPTRRAWALMSIAEHAFQRLYLNVTSS